MYSLAMALVFTLQAPENVPVKDSVDVEKRFEASVGMSSFYVWRGQSWGGKQPAIEFEAAYSVSEKFTVGFWGLTHFSGLGIGSGRPSDGYREFDIGVTYRVSDFLSVSLWDYYWPALHPQEGVSLSYFNYGPGSSKSVDATIDFDLSDRLSVPLSGCISTLVAGNDYAISSGGRLRRNFTTYVEVGWLFDNVLEKAGVPGIELRTVAGAVINNRAQYYTYADYDGISFVNLQAAATKSFNLGYGFTLPVTIAYTRNATGRNAGRYGPDFFTASIAFAY